MDSEKEGFEQLIQLAWSFRGAKVLLLACKLDLFSHLSHQAKSAADLATELGVDVRALAILMDALVSLDLLDKQDAKYSNTPLATAYLIKGSPTYRGNILRHMDRCWDSWSGLAQVIKQGQPVANDSLYDEEECNREFIWGMNDVGQDRVGQILEHLDLSEVKHMLDLGGGAATHSIAFVKRYPGLQATVFDLPLTLKVARENIQQQGVQTRIKTKAGDFFRDELGQGYDLVWMSQVLHAQGETGCKQLVDKAYRALEPGGRAVIHDFLLNEDRTHPPNSALFAVHMLAVTEGGRVYTPAEIMNWLQEANFSNIAWKQVSDYTMLVEGWKEMG